MKLSVLSTMLVLAAASSYAAFPGLARGPGRVVATPVCAVRGNVVRARDCGAKGDGAASDRDALQRCASAAAGGGICLLDAGTFAVDPERDKAIRIPNGVTLKGAGASATRIVLTGKAQLDQLLTFENPSNDWVEDLTIVGNGVNSCAGCGGLVAFVANEQATKPMTNFGIRNVTLENDRHDYWVYFFNGARVPMHGIVIDGLRAKSRDGNCRGLDQVGVPCDVIAFYGQYNDLGGTIDGVTITGADADGTYIKRFVDFWEGTANAHLTRSNLRNFGAHAASDSGAYAVMAYYRDPSKSGAAWPSHIWITGNTIANPLTNGIYLANVRDAHVDANRISGQSDTADGTLPHGAISFNSTSGEATGNVLTDNQYGIEASPDRNAGSVVVLSGNTIASARTGAKGIVALAKVAPADIEIVDNRIAMTGPKSFAIMINGSQSEPVGNVHIAGGAAAAGFADVYLYDTAGGAPGAASVTIDGGVYAGNPTNGALVAANCSSVPLAVRNAVFDGAAYRDADGISARGCTNIRLEGLTLKNMTGGQGRMLRLDGANASVTGTQYMNVAPDNR